MFGGDQKGHGTVFNWGVSRFSFRHATQAQTLHYLCIQEDAVKDVFMRDL